MSSLHVVTSVAELQAHLRSARARGERVALVPTMGALHRGHLGLVDEARRRADRVVASVFVNPTQFAPGEDFDRYPRDLPGDRAALADAGADLLFAPPAEEIYPPGDATRVRVGRLTEVLCGPLRPGHFEGVATVVTKLFGAVLPDVAVFGRKDYQQLAVIRRLVTDLLLPIEIVGVPTVREADGLAMSSRNAYLSADGRARAGRIARGLASALAAFDSGERRVATLEALVRAELAAANAAVEYVAVADPDSLAPIPEVVSVEGRALVAVAVRVDGTRLIDNVVLGEERLGPFG